MQLVHFCILMGLAGIACRIFTEGTTAPRNKALPRLEGSFETEEVRIVRASPVAKQVPLGK